jgi:lipopolysaccharide export LptBFGC system permease protein LptF
MIVSMIFYVLTPLLLLLFFSWVYGFSQLKEAQSIRIFPFLAVFTPTRPSLVIALMKAFWKSEEFLAHLLTRLGPGVCEEDLIRGE